MMRMVCECVRFAPLAAGHQLQRRATPDAVRVRDDKARAAPDDSRPAGGLTAPNLDDGLLESLRQAIQVRRGGASRAEHGEVHSRPPRSAGVIAALLMAPPRRNLIVTTPSFGTLDSPSRRSSGPCSAFPFAMSRRSPSIIPALSAGEPSAIDMINRPASPSSPCCFATDPDNAAGCTATQMTGRRT